MFGGAAFGSVPAGGAAFVGALIVEASASMVGQAAILPAVVGLGGDGDAVQ